MGNKHKKKTLSKPEAISDGKKTRKEIQPTYDDQKPSWKFHKIDKDGKWGWDSISNEQWLNKFLPQLENFEGMTWHEIKKASGGKNHGTNHHSIPINDIITDAQKRLTDLNMDDLEEVFSLRIEGQIRLYGIREGAMFKILWFDTEHEICPSQKKHT